MTRKYQIKAEVKKGFQEQVNITMFRVNKITESDIKKIYKGATVDNYSCVKVA